LVCAGDGEAAQLDQRVAVFTGWQRVQAGDGAFGVVTGESCGVIQGAGSVDRSPDAFQVFDTAFLNGVAYQGGLLLGAFTHGVDQRQGRLAFGKVVADVLAQTGGVALVVEQVVDQLEGDAQVVAKGAQGFALRLVGAGQGSCCMSGGLEQHRCLDRKSTRLNSSHVKNSYAVVCLKKKN